ncbi:alpha/beta hydrolase family protein [Streptomyces flavofungini]|uniref:alpha/beta hydrolase family protein n=1 Tax=Streptomyces flavofungini TaxID=68200 RepID=UPI0034E004D6
MRRTLSVVALCGALLSSSVTADAAASGPAPGPPSGRVFSYGPHARQNITVYGGKPGKRPALVILHGGSWRRDTDWSGWARWFAARGFTVYDTDYRLTSDAVWPAQRDDVLAALRWVRGREGGARPLVLGSSAGGHLAAQAATYTSGGSRVRAVAALSPVASPYRAWTDGGAAGASADRRALRGAAERLAGCRPDRGDQRCWGRWTDLAAASHASRGDAPLLLVHSARDFVPRSHSTALAGALRKARQRDVVIKTVPGSAHGGHLLGAPGVAKNVLQWLRGRA